MQHPNRSIVAVAALITALAGAAITGCEHANTSLSAASDSVTTELTANTWTGSTQYEPAIAADAEGRMLVVWSSRRQEDGAFGVFAQLVDPLGRALGTEIHVNQHIEGAQASPAVAFDPASGAALIVWESSHQDGSGSGIVGRWYEATPLGAVATSDEFAVNATRAGEQNAPSVAIDQAGRALVAWTSTGDGQSSAVTRAFDAQGRPLSEEIALGARGAHSPIVTAASDGFLVVGSARDDSGRPAPLWMQRLASDLTRGKAMPIAESTWAQDIEPSIGVDAKGRATIAWMRRGDRGYNVMRRGFDASGNPAGAETVVAECGEGWLSGVAVASAPDGRTMVSWNVEERSAPDPEEWGEREARGSDILAQRFDARGVALGEPERFNTIDEGRQRLTIGSVAARSIWTGADQIALAWNGRTDRDSNGVGVTLRRPASLTAPEPIAVAPRPAVTPGSVAAADEAAPVWDPNFVPEPPDVNVRGVGPDFGFIGTQNTGWRPPDPEVAVGPDHVVVVVNGRIIFRRKSDGGQTFSQDIVGGGGFWGAQGAGGFVFDPIAQYDTYSDRFIVAASERSGSQQLLDIAISDDSDPNGSWNKFRINVSSYGGDIDYPILGIDQDAVYLTSDFFASPIGNWIFILDKADLMAGTISMNAVQAAGGPNVLGAMMNYDADSPAQYFATTYFGGSTQILLKAVTDPLGSPVLHEYALGVPLGYTQPPGADQLGTSNLVSTVDFRIKHGVVRNGSMWVAHNTNDPDGEGGPFMQDPIARVRWMEIELNGWPTSGSNPTVRQAGTINAGTGIHTWCADISVDDAGNAGIVFCRSSADEFVSVSRAVRRSTDPLGTFRQPVFMQISSTPEDLDRWGDYSGIQEDPVDPGVFWGHNEYRTTSWRTWVGRFSPQTPNPIDFTLLDPPDGAPAVEVAPTLDWESAQDATSYDVTIATDPDLVNTVVTTNVVASSWAVPNATLSCDTLYYWGVTANGVGGTTTSTPGVFSFTTGLIADLNNDGVVDTADLGLMLGVFGSAGPLGDLNGDNIVDTADLGVLLDGFGQGCN
ncbi:MAG: hypothetical protein H6813_00800 [Phycisphaeraceae bacterium]|nr:hypothetical protein [Phycisphaeraceae bacterium]MCB9847376.1 hypothetical protein [Phycisphaeraceae bacterium]